MKLVKMKCENCGATLEVNSELDKINCNFCGAEIMIDDEATTLKRVEEAKLKSRKENHEQTLKERDDLLEQEIKEKKIRDEIESPEKFKKSKFSKVLIIFAVLCLLFAFTIDFNFATIIAIIQTGLFIAAYLMGRGIVKEPFKKCYVVLAIVAFILIIPFLSLFKTGGDRYQKVDWEDIKMSTIVPEPSSNKIHIYDNETDELSIEVTDCSLKDFNNYVKEVKEKGFTIDAEDKTSSYEAYNSEGYFIDLYHYDTKDEMSIKAKAPLAMKENAWSSNKLSNLLPVPKSNYGKVDSESETEYVYYAGKTSKDDLEEYINEVKEKGFTVDYNKHDYYYSAYNKNKYYVSVEYVGFNTVKIRIDVPEEEEEKTKTEETKKESMRSDFKKFMDSYEKFIDSYISFMKKYNANPSSKKLIKEYGDYMSKYSKMMSDFEKWEDKDLNTAEELYYYEVQTRVSKKLMEASL